MQRRDFLAALAAIAAGCTAAPESTEPASSTTSNQPTNPPPTTLPEAPPSTPTVEIPLVDPVDSPPGPAGLASEPFPLGLASGDPDGSSVVLWTALGTTSEEPAAVAWDLALDSGFEGIIRSGTSEAAPGASHTVHLLVEELPPDTALFYRFRIGQTASTIGRTRTLPAGATEQFGLAVSSCQARDDLTLWDNHTVMAEDPDVDLVVWLGDFIYEQGARTYEDYRARYTEVRSDPRLQANSAAHPWLFTWDDHEVVNDYDSSVDPERRAAAYRAWWDFTPTRLPRPTETGLRIHRTVDIGDLLRIVLLDCRQYQGPGTVLGAEQLGWFGEVTQHRARHTLVASPVLMSSLGVGEVAPDYAFEAHPVDQVAVASALESAPAPIIVSGDLHAAMELSFAPGIKELMAPPLSSAFPPDLADLLPFLPLVSESVVSAEASHGYLRLSFTGDTVSPAFVVV